MVVAVIVTAAVALAVTLFQRNTSKDVPPKPLTTAPTEVDVDVPPEMQTDSATASPGVVPENDSPSSQGPAPDLLAQLRDNGVLFGLSSEMSSWREEHRHAKWRFDPEDLSLKASLHSALWQFAPVFDEFVARDANGVVQPPPFRSSKYRQSLITESASGELQPSRVKSYLVFLDPQTQLRRSEPPREPFIDFNFPDYPIKPGEGWPTAHLQTRWDPTSMKYQQVVPIEISMRTLVRAASVGELSDVAPDAIVAHLQYNLKPEDNRVRVSEVDAYVDIATGLLLYTRQVIVEGEDNGHLVVQLYERQRVSMGTQSPSETRTAHKSAKTWATEKVLEELKVSSVPGHLTVENAELWGRLYLEAGGSLRAGAEYVLASAMGGSSSTPPRWQREVAREWFDDQPPLERIRMVHQAIHRAGHSVSKDYWVPTGDYDNVGQMYAENIYKLRPMFNILGIRSDVYSSSLEMDAPHLGVKIADGCLFLIPPSPRRAYKYGPLKEAVIARGGSDFHVEIRASRWNRIRFDLTASRRIKMPTMEKGTGKVTFGIYADDVGSMTSGVIEHTNSGMVVNRRRMADELSLSGRIAVSTR